MRSAQITQYCVYNTSLHLGYCNSVALALAGIDADTPDPQGAEIGRDANGNPNGVLKAGPAMALVVRHNTKLKQGNIAEGCLSVLGQANAVGITTLCDQGTGMFQGIKGGCLSEHAGQWPHDGAVSLQRWAGYGRPLGRSQSGLGRGR